MAWHIAALGRARKMPDLEKLMLKPAKANGQPSEKDAALVRGYLIALAMRSDGRPKAGPA